MSDEEKKVSQAQAEPPAPEQPPQTPAEPVKQTKAPLNDQKKNALMRYMAVLFGVAFLLVALSFLIQIRDSSVTITQLNQSNASALQNAEKLQADNRDLTAENKRLNQELHDTLTQLDEAKDQLAAVEADAEQQKQQMQSMGEEMMAYHLLTDALSRFAKADETLTVASLQALDALKDKMVPPARTLYDNLVTALTAAAEKQE